VASRDSLAAFWLGATYDSEGRHDEAISAYRQAGAATYFLEQGHDPYAAGDYESACSSYSRASEIAPDMALAQMYMGHCHMRRGDFSQAEAYYRRAIQLDPQYGYPYIHLANLLREQLQRPDLAREVLMDCVSRVESAHWRQECLAEGQ
jgi:tetratricopeptide (TPR) repeat protein